MHTGTTVVQIFHWDAFLSLDEISLKPVLVTTKTSAFVVQTIIFRGTFVHHELVRWSFTQA